MKPDIQNEKDIATFVHAFYAKVEKDERLGYIFNDFAEVDWDEHLPKMVDFWSKLLFGTSHYNGRPFRQHMPLPIKPGDFRRWVGLFEETVNEHFEGERAEYAKEMAVNIANSFSSRMAMDGKFDNQKEE